MWLAHYVRGCARLSGYRAKKQEEAKRKEQARILGKGRTKLSFSLGGSR
jgi:hypothetical protein